MANDDTDHLPIYEVRLQALPGGPAEKRLKMALKCLLHSYGFKCLSAVEAPLLDAPADDTPATDTPAAEQPMPLFWTGGSRR